MYFTTADVILISCLTLGLILTVIALIRMNWR